MRYDSVPLCVDLDRTIIDQDSTLQILYVRFCQKPIPTLRLLLTFHFLEPGKFKDSMLKDFNLDSINWKLNLNILAFVRKRILEGSEVWLVTGSGLEVANYFYDKLGIFTGFYCSNETFSLKGKNKREFLEKRFGYQNFDYIGDAIKDGFVFSGALRSYAPKKSKLKLTTFFPHVKISYL